MQGPRVHVSSLQAFSVYATLLAIWVTGTRIATMKMAWASAEVVGWSLSLSAVLGVIGFMCFRYAEYRDRARQMTPSEESGFSFREDACTLEDLPMVVEIGTRGIGPNFPPTEWIRERLAHNPSIVRLVRATSTNDIVGFTMVYPLTASAVRGLDSGRIRSGTELRTTHLCKSFGRACGVYIGVLVAEGRKPRAYVLKMLRRQFPAFNLQGRSATVYGKPATKDGARLLRTFGFVPIPGNESICRTTYIALEEKL